MASHSHDTSGELDLVHAYESHGCFRFPKKGSPRIHFKTTEPPVDWQRVLKNAPFVGFALNLTLMSNHLAGRDEAKRG